MKTWKQYEIDLTKYLGEHFKFFVTRMSRGKRGEEVEDIHWGPFSVEAKTRKAIPQYIKDWVEQAKTNRAGKIPLVVWHENRASKEDDLVVMPLGWLLVYLRETVSDEVVAYNEFLADIVSQIKEFLQEGGG